jgi:hypothetical protein
MTVSMVRKDCNRNSSNERALRAALNRPGSMCRFFLPMIFMIDALLNILVLGRGSLLPAH